MVAIRRLTADDADAVQAFVRALSPRSRRERYFSAITELTPKQLARTLRPAGRDDVSIAAFHGAEMVALAECAGGEIAVVVADPWQGSGIGRALLEKLVAHARQSRLSELHGVTYDGNRAMLRLAASLGFRATRDDDPELIAMDLALP